MQCCCGGFPPYFDWKSSVDILISIPHSQLVSFYVIKFELETWCILLWHQKHRHILVFYLNFFNHFASFGSVWIDLNNLDSWLHVCSLLHFIGSAYNFFLVYVKISLSVWEKKVSLSDCSWNKLWHGFSLSLILVSANLVIPFALSAIIQHRSWMELAKLPLPLYRCISTFAVVTRSMFISLHYPVFVNIRA